MKPKLFVSLIALIFTIVCKSQILVPLGLTEDEVKKNYPNIQFVMRYVKSDGFNGSHIYMDASSLDNSIQYEYEFSPDYETTLNILKCSVCTYKFTNKSDYSKYVEYVNNSVSSENAKITTESTSYIRHIKIRGINTAITGGYSELHYEITFIGNVR